MSLFTTDSTEQKNNVLIIIVIVLLLIFAIFVMLKFENLLGVLISLGSIILSGTVLIIFIE